MLFKILDITHKLNYLVNNKCYLQSLQLAFNPFSLACSLTVALIQSAPDLKRHGRR